MLRRDDAAKWIIAGIGLLVVGAALGLLFSFKDKTKIHIASQVVNARIADSPTEREQGLSGTKQLADNEGLLFVFDTAAKWGIWMKDMNYSIDIVWLDENKKVVYVAVNVAPETYPKVFEPETAAKYVLELPAGFAERNNLSVGTFVSFRDGLW